MDVSLIAAIAAFGVVFAGVWGYTRRHLVHLREQRRYYDLFFRQVSAFRCRLDVPLPIREFVEELVSVPLNSTYARFSIYRALTGTRNELTKEESGKLREALGEMSHDARDELQSLIASFMEVMSHSHPIVGPIYRRFRMKGLSYQTRAQATIDDVSGHHWSRPLAA